jgi:transposase-like protein
MKWRKQLLEGAQSIFEIKRPDISAKAEAKMIAELEDRLSHKDEIIAELASELLALKKNNTGRTSGRRR